VILSFLKPVSPTEENMLEELYQALPFGNQTWLAGKSTI
jgi:hypothetical protein